MISLSGLPFYDSILKQNRFLAKCDGRCLDGRTFLAPKFALIPFVFSVDASADVIEAVHLMLVGEGEDPDTIAMEIDPDQFYFYNYQDSDYVVNRWQPIQEVGNEAAAEIECGKYYLQVVIGDTTYCSEIFEVKGGNSVVETSLVTNGHFTTGTDGWVLSGGASWDSLAKAGKIVNGGSFSWFLALGESDMWVYEFTFTVNSITGTATVASDLFEFEVTQVGTYTTWFAGGSSVSSGNNLIISTTGTDDIIFDNVSFKKVMGLKCFNTIIAGNTCDFADIPFLSGIYKSLYFTESDLNRPEYTRDSDVEEDGDRNAFNTFDKVSKAYRMSKIMAIEPLLDRLQVIPIHNDLTVVIGQTEEQITGEFFIESSWPDNCVAEATVVIKSPLMLKNNCCQDLSAVCCESAPTLVLNNPESPSSTISLSGDAVDCGFIELMYKKCAGANQPIECEGLYTSSGQVITPTEFNADGFTFDAPDFAEFTYWFQVRVVRAGCPAINSNKVAAFII